MARRRHGLSRILRNRTRAAAAAVVGLALVGAAPGPARGLSFEEWVPGLTMTPFLSERLEYETNVFQTPTRAKASMISRATPGFVLDYGRGTLQLGAGYRMEILRYLDVEGLDTINHVAVGQAKLVLSKLQLSFRDDYIQTTVPPGSELTGPIKTSTNILAPTAEYRLTERFAVGANYTWTHIKFPGTTASTGADSSAVSEQNETVKQLERDEHLAGVSVFWKFRPTADVGLGYQYGTKTFESATDRDARYHVLSLQLRGDITSKLSSTFRLGILHREAVEGVAPDFTGVIMGGGWVFRMTTRTTFTLDTDRSIQESIFEGAQYYVGNSVAVGVRQEFSPKLSAFLRLGAGLNTYNTKQQVDTRIKWRNDTLQSATVGVEYAIRPWLRTGAEYSYQKRSSNFREFDYDDSKFSGRITVQF